MADIQRIMNGYIDADEAAEYEEALVMDEELISGTDYRLILTTSYTGDYPPINQ